MLDGVEALIVPDDLVAALDHDQAAREHWNRFTPSARKQILWWIAQAKRPATRSARIEQTVRLASRGERAQ